MGSQFVDFCYKFTGFGLFFDNYWRCTCVNDKNNNNNKNGLTLSLPECLMEFCKVALTFESVDEILWCGHSNESSLPVLTHGTICFSKFYKMKFGNLVEICLWLHVAVKGLIDSFWMNSAWKQHFETPPLVSIRNDVWGKSAEIPRCWLMSLIVWS